MNTGKQTRYEQAHGSHNAQYNSKTQNYYYATAGRADTAPTPISTVPFSRNPNFVEREEWHTLNNKLASNASYATKIALVGLGGSGKSQLASEYCHRIWKPAWDPSSSKVWVLWVHVNSSTRLEESIRDIAVIVGISRGSDPDVNIFQLFNAWLRDPNKHWLLVLDNADDPRVLFDPLSSDNIEGGGGHARAAKRAIDYLSVPSHGHVILTTRYRGVASKFVDDGDTGTITQIGTMQPDQAVELLRKKVDQQCDTAYLEDVAAELGYVPLALVQAAAYIQHKPCTAKQYLRMLKHSDRSKRDLLKSHPEAEREQTKFILTTWQITFEHIREIRPSAADRLSVMSFFDHRSIPKCLLGINRFDRSTELHMNETEENDSDISSRSSTASPYSDEESETGTDISLEADMQTLRDFDLVSVRPKYNEYEMHSLVPFAVKNWLDMRGESVGWYGHSLENLWTAIPEKGTYECWPQWQILYPHARLVTQSNPGSREQKLTKASILTNMAGYMFFRGSYNSSASLSREALAIRKKLLDEKDAVTIINENNLAIALQRCGRYDEAEEIFERIWRKNNVALGPGDTGTLHALGCLLETLNESGKHQAAENLSQEALRLCEENLEPEHEVTLHVSIGRACALWHLQRYKEVDQLSRRLLQAFGKVTGEAEGPHLALAINFGLFLTTQGKFEDANAMEHWTLAEHTRKYGLEHPDSLLAMNNLAWSLLNQRRPREAEILSRQGLDMCEKALGRDHDLTLESTHTLAYICRALRLDQEASRLINTCVERSQKVFGADHPITTERRTCKKQWATEDEERSEWEIIEGVGDL